jgi:hypothetical protein
MGMWRYADAIGSWQGEQALEMALAADGKRNLFHDEVLLQLEDHQRPLGHPPLIAERRLHLKVIPNGWPHLVGEPTCEWISEPIPLLAVRRRWVWKRRVNETAARVVARHFFDDVHDELHATAARTPARRGLASEQEQLRALGGMTTR